MVNRLINFEKKNQEIPEEIYPRDLADLEMEMDKYLDVLLLRVEKRGINSVTEKDFGIVNLFEFKIRLLRVKYGLVSFDDE